MADGECTEGQGGCGKRPINDGQHRRMAYLVSNCGFKTFTIFFFANSLIVLTSKTMTDIKQTRLILN